MYGCIDGCMDVWMDVCMYGCMYVCTYRSPACPILATNTSPPNILYYTPRTPYNNPTDGLDGISYWRLGRGISSDTVIPCYHDTIGSRCGTWYNPVSALPTWLTSEQGCGGKR